MCLLSKICFLYWFYFRLFVFRTFFTITHIIPGLCRGNRIREYRYIISLYPPSPLPPTGSFQDHVPSLHHLKDRFLRQLTHCGLNNSLALKQSEQISEREQLLCRMHLCSYMTTKAENLQRLLHRDLLCWFWNRLWNISDSLSQKMFGFYHF